MSNKKIAIGCFALAIVFGLVGLFTALFAGNLSGGANSSAQERTGKTYYISNDGSDANDGLSEEKPFQTISKLNTLTLQEGDAVLFKRGDAFYNETFAAPLP